VKARDSPLVCDASVVLNLGHRGELSDLVKELMAERDLTVTPEVVREVSRDDPAYYQEFLKGHFKLHEKPLAVMGRIPQEARDSLDPGELSVLAVCLEEDWTACIDETLARKVAVGLGISLTGTLGLLGHALVRNWMTNDDCLAVVRKLKQNGFYCPKVHANDDFPAYLARMK
jgi:predicted nucleic acid-binding protein